AAGDAFAIRTEGHTGDRACVPLEGKNLGALVRVPHLHLPRLVIAPCPTDDMVAIRAAVHACDMACDTPEGRHLGALVSFPHLYLAWLAIRNAATPPGADEAFAIRAERHTDDRACVPPEGGDLVEACGEVVVFPAAQVPLAGLQMVPGQRGTPMLPFRLGQH